MTVWMVRCTTTFGLKALTDNVLISRFLIDSVKGLAQLIFSSSSKQYGKYSLRMRWLGVVAMIILAILIKRLTSADVWYTVALSIRHSALTTGLASWKLVMPSCWTDVLEESAVLPATRHHWKPKASYSLVRQHVKLVIAFVSTNVGDSDSWTLSRLTSSLIYHSRCRLVSQPS